jgi:hypothetical protein
MPSFMMRMRPSEPDVEYFRLDNAKPDGEVVAIYSDHEVCDVVIDDRGHRYVFVGLAPRKANGSYDVKPLKAGEVILDPGLLYQLIPTKRGWQV